MQRGKTPEVLVSWPVRVFTVPEAGGKAVPTPGYEVKAASFDDAVRAVRKRYAGSSWLIRSIALVAPEGGPSVVSARSLKSRGASDRTLIVYLEKDKRK